MLVVGVIASLGFSRTAINTSMMVGGLLLAIAAMTGLFAHIRRLFTPRVVAILLLVALTLAPAIIQLIADPGLRAPVLPRAAFAAIMPLLYVLRIQALEGHLEVDTHPLVDRGGLVRMGPFLPGLERYGKGWLTSRFPLFLHPYDDRSVIRAGRSPPSSSVFSALP